MRLLNRSNEVVSVAYLPVNKIPAAYELKIQWFSSSYEAIKIIVASHSLCQPKYERTVTATPKYLVATTTNILASTRPQKWHALP